jgi:glycine dehydrogenase subunit 2
MTVAATHVIPQPDTKTIFEQGAPGRRAFQCPEMDVPVVDGLLPAAHRRMAPPRLPEVSEPELVRHYVRVSKKNYDLDSGFYPLGSCTMKHNPRLHERVAALPGHARLHPLQHPEHAQGALELMHNLEHALGEIAGLPHVCLQPVRRLARRAARRAAHRAPTTRPRARSGRRSSRRTPPTGRTPPR